MNKQEYLIITFHSLDDAMDLDAKQTASMKGRLIPKPSVIDAGCVEAYTGTSEEK